VLSLFSNPTNSALADGELSLPAQMNKRFTPDIIPAGGVSVLSVNIYNPNVFPLTLSTVPAAWVDTLPAGVVFANPANAVSSCGGTVSMIGQTLSLIGGLVPAQVGDTPGVCTVTVNVTSVIPGNHDNIIPANNLKATDPSGTLPITNTTPATHTLQVNTIQPPSLSKTFSPNTQWIGLNAVLSIRIRNNDLNYPLTGVSVTDNLPSGITVANTTVSFSNCGGSAAITGPGGIPLAAGQNTISISQAAIAANTTCVVNINITSLTTGVYVNTIPALAINSDQAVSNQAAASAPINFQSIGMEKNFSPASIEAGGTSTLTITLKNPSAADYTGVGFTDNLPSGLTIASPPALNQCGGTISYTSTSLTLDGGTVPWGTPTLPGQCTITALVSGSISGSFTNTIPAGELVTDQGATNVADATSNLSIYGQGKGVTASKTFSPSTIPVEGESRLAIYITAPADQNLTNFSITDALPTGVRVAASPAATKNANCLGGTFSPSGGDTIITYSGGSIAAGKQCILYVYVTSNAAGSYTNIVSPVNITNDQNQTTSSSFSRTLTVSGISVRKSFFPSSVNIQGISSLSIVLENTNDRQLENVTLIDNLPAGIVIADDPNVSSTCVDGIITAPELGTSISMTDAKIPARIGSVPGICTVNVDVKGTVIGEHLNRIQVNQVSGVLQGLGITVTNPVRADATLTVNELLIQVVKTFDPITVFGGASSTMTVRLTNSNNTVINGITFTDDLPQSTDPDNLGGMHIASPAQASSGTCGGTISAISGQNTFSFSGGSLNANSNCTLSIKVTMDVSGNLTNTIPASGITSANGAYNPQSASATLTNLAGASLTKYFTTNPVVSGSGNASQVAVVIKNTGNVGLSGLGFTDSFDTGLTISTPPDASQCGGSVSYTETSFTLSDGVLAADEECTILVDVVAPAAGSYQNCIDAGTLISDQNATNADPTCDTLIVEQTLTPPQIAKTFSPNPVRVGQSSALTFTITNPNNASLSGVAFTDTFPSGMTRASIPNVSQCGGSVSSTSDSVSLTAGTIAANSSCTVTISVRTDTGGDFENTSDAVSSTNGGTGNTATATLTAIAPPLIEKLFVSNPITAGGTSILTFTLTNPAENTLALAGVAFNDVFPAGILRASVPLSSQCGGTVASSLNSVSLSGGTIAVGGSCTVEIEVTAPNAGSFLNTSQAVTSTNGGTGQTASSTLVVNGVGLSLVKSTTTPNYKEVGALITYDYQLTNTGDAILYAPFLVSDDHFPADIVCGAAADLSPGDSLTCSVDYTVTADDITAKSVTNLATASALDESSNLVTSNESSTTVKLAALNLRKSTTTLSFLNAGNTIRYTYTLTNVGSLTLFAPFSVSDDHFLTPLSCGTAASLQPGGVLECIRNYTVTAGDVTAGFVTNIASSTASDAASGGDIVTSNQDSVTVYKVTAPAVAKEFLPDTIQTGGLSTLTFTITNLNGAVSLTGVGLVDNLPAAITPAYAPQPNQCGGTVTYDSGNNRLTLANGSIIPAGSCTVSVVVTSSTPASHLNTSNAVTSSNGGNGNTAQDTLHVVSAPTITKSFSPSTLTQGESTTLTITIRNPLANTAELTGVAFTDTFPVGMRVSDTGSASTSGCGSPLFAPLSGDISLSFSSGTISVGGTCVITVPVTADAGVFNNTTSPVSSTNGGTGVASNTATLTVNMAADLSVTKDDGVSAVDRGEPITYSIVVTNNGPADVTGASVFDNFPSSLDDAAWTCAAGTGASCTASGTGNISDSVSIPAGGNVTYTINATVAMDTQTSIVNSATVLPPTGLIDPDYDNNIATDTDLLNLLNIEKSAEIEIFETFDQVINYSFTITNAGTSTLGDPFLLTDDRAAITCAYPESLAPSEQFTCSGTDSVTLEDLDHGSITNHANVTGKDPDGDSTTSNTAEETIFADQIPVIGVAKELVSITKISAGTYDVTYSIRLKNYGNVSLQDVQAQDNLDTAYPSPATFAIQSIESTDLSVNDTFDGSLNLDLLAGGNTLAAFEEKTLTIVVRVIPTSSGPYENSVLATAVHSVEGPVSDISQNGDDPDPDDNGSPIDNEDPTPSNFGAEIFDPPYGEKTFDAVGRPILEWNMVWINDTNIVGINASVSDPIPNNTTFYNNGIDSGYPVPASAPFGSTSEGVSCTSSAASSTTYCYYEAPTIEYPLGRIVWEGTIGPDFGVTDPDLALNAMLITFNVLIEDGTNYVNNVASISTDRNGDGDVEDPGEQDVEQARMAWDVRASNLPDTGFAPGKTTILPLQPSNYQYTDFSDLTLEIPSLGVNLPVMGIPSDGRGSWDISWLFGQAGWLQGTTYPTWVGNTAITAHVYDANGQPGPFVDLGNLRWGDLIILHAWGQDYIYEVREIDQWVDPADTSILAEEPYSYLTLITCKGYQESLDQYQWRVAVRAVQTRVVGR
jgi:LPXTG-site transpeptidase (sortase) family protein